MKRGKKRKEKNPPGSSSRLARVFGEIVRISSNPGFHDLTRLLDSLRAFYFWIFPCPSPHERLAGRGSYHKWTDCSFCAEDMRSVVHWRKKKNLLKAAEKVSGWRIFFRWKIDSSCPPLFFVVSPNGSSKTFNTLYFISIIVAAWFFRCPCSGKKKIFLRVLMLS